MSIFNGQIFNYKKSDPRITPKGLDLVRGLDVLYFIFKKSEYSLN